MKTYNIINEKYNVNFNLNFDSFDNFIESLKESRKYYYNYCNLKNININDFDNYYIKNINILEGELLKYYMLITNNINADKHLDVNNLQENINDIIVHLECRNHISGQYFSLTELIRFYKNLKKYLDFLTYKSIYEKELDCILTNLPIICESNILSKKVVNNANRLNLIDLNNKEFIEVD